MKPPWSERGKKPFYSSNIKRKKSSPKLISKCSLPFSHGYDNVTFYWGKGEAQDIIDKIIAIEMSHQQRGGLLCQMSQTSTQPVIFQTGKLLGYFHYRYQILP